MHVFICKSKFSRMMNIEQCLISAISSKIDDAISYLNLAMYNMQQHFCLPFISAPSIQFIFLSCYELYELWVIISHGALLHLLGIHIYCWLWIPLNMGCSWEQNEKLSVKFSKKYMRVSISISNETLHLHVQQGKQWTAECFPRHNNAPFCHDKVLDFSPKNGENCRNIFCWRVVFLWTRICWLWNPLSMRCRCKEIFRLSANFKEVKKCGCWQVVFCAPGGYKSSWGVTDRTHLKSQFLVL